MSFETSRRGFLTGASAAVLAPLHGVIARAENAPFKLAVATYSLREFQRDLAIKMIKQMNVRYANVKEYHLPANDTPKQLSKGRREFEEAGIEIVAGGVITLDKNDDADIRCYFE